MAARNLDMEASGPNASGTMTYVRKKPAFKAIQRYLPPGLAARGDSNSPMRVDITSTANGLVTISMSGSNCPFPTARESTPSTASKWAVPTRPESESVAM
jgi:hypothetical protein